MFSLLIFVSVDDNDKGIAFAKRVKSVLHLHADSKRAEAMELYMRNQFAFFGIPAPARKELLKPHLVEWRGLSIEAAWTAVDWWWVQQERECQYVAMELIQRRQKDFQPGHLELIEALILGKSWWDTVDFIAANLAGSYMRRFPERMDSVTSRWNSNENLWLRRTSIIFQLKYRDEVREDLLFTYCAHCAPERDFFIRKAIGWALRQYAKTKPERVRHFLRTHTLSALSVKEAEKSLT